jgi:ABC-2 type transport system permease protein
MSTVIATPASAEHKQLRKARPSFFGLLRAEFFKVLHQWTTWILLVLLAGVMILPYLIEFTVPSIKDQIQQTPLHFFYNEMSIGLSIVRVFTGIFLLIITARMIGLEYQLGTIRVLLSRGVGRLQLLFAKLLTVVIIALVLLAFGLVLNYLLTLILVSSKAGNLTPFNALTSQFWSDTRTYILTILLNMGVTILLATTAAVIGRSLSFGLSAALVFFPIDNVGTIIMQLAYRLTNNDFWLSLTAYFLGPNLNVMPMPLTSGRAESIGASPLYFVDEAHKAHGVLVDGTHTLGVAAVYAAIFAITAIWLTWKREVKE